MLFHTYVPASLLSYISWCFFIILLIVPILLLFFIATYIDDAITLPPDTLDCFIFLLIILCPLVSYAIIAFVAFAGYAICHATLLSLPLLLIILLMFATAERYAMLLYVPLVAMDILLPYTHVITSFACYAVIFATLVIIFPHAHCYADVSYIFVIIFVAMPGA